MSGSIVSSSGAVSSSSGVGPARRVLSYGSLREMLADLEAITSGPVVGLGAWTPAQNIDHVRRLIRISHAGTDIKLALGYRMLGRLLKGRLLRTTFKPGLKTVDLFEPAADVGLEKAMSAFREEVAIASQAGAMRHPSPLLGALSHEDWERLHCRHAELHFGYIVADPGR